MISTRKIALALFAYTTCIYSASATELVQNQQTPLQTDQISNQQLATTTLYESDDIVNAAIAKVDVADPRVIYFSTIGSTHMVDFEPSTGSATIVYCNTCDRQCKSMNGDRAMWNPTNIRPVSKPGDLLNLTPVRQTIKFTLPEPAVIDKSFTTAGSPYMEAGLINLFKAMNIYPDEGYKGTVLIDQYREGLPFKFSFKNVDELRWLLAYFVERLELPEGFGLPFPVAEQRPIAMIDCKGIEKLTEGEKQILKQLFIVASQKNEAAKNFFGTVATNYAAIVGKSLKECGFKNEKIGETIIREIKDKATLDGKKLLVGTVGALITIVFISNLSSAMKVLGCLVGDMIPGMHTLTVAGKRLDNAINDDAKKLK